MHATAKQLHLEHSKLGNMPSAIILLELPGELTKGGHAHLDLFLRCETGRKGGESSAGCLERVARRSGFLAASSCDSSLMLPALESLRMRTFVVCGSTRWKPGDMVHRSVPSAVLRTKQLLSFMLGHSVHTAFYTRRTTRQGRNGPQSGATTSIRKMQGVQIYANCSGRNGIALTQCIWQNNLRSGEQFLWDACLKRAIGMSCTAGVACC